MLSAEVGGWPWPVIREFFREFWGVFQEKFFLRNMRNIVPKAKFFWHPKKIHAKCGYTARNFLAGGRNFLTGGWSRVTCHVPLADAVPQITIQRLNSYNPFICRLFAIC